MGKHHFGSLLNLSKVGCEWCPFCNNSTDARTINEIRRCGGPVAWICAALPQMFGADLHRRAGRPLARQVHRLSDLLIPQACREPLDYAE